MWRVIVLIVIVTISSSLQQPVEIDVQYKVQTDGGSFATESEFVKIEVQYDAQTEEQTEVSSLSTQSIYEIPFFKANWFKAVEYCNYLGLRLAILDTKEKEASLYAAMRASDIFTGQNDLVWIGANNLADEGNFHWHGTGRRVVHTNWANDEPNNGGPREENCVEAGNHLIGVWTMQWQWNDAECTQRKYFACERFQSL